MRHEELNFKMKTLELMVKSFHNWGYKSESFLMYNCPNKLINFKFKNEQFQKSKDAACIFTYISP